MPTLKICLAHRVQNHPVKQELFYSLTSLHFGPEQPAAIRWKGGEKSRKHTDYSSLPHCRLFDLSGAELGGKNSKSYNRCRLLLHRIKHSNHEIVS